jgi:hypothetical protein
MFMVKGYLNGISYAVQVGVSKARANDGVVAGDPRVIGMLQTYEGLPITLGVGRRSVTGTNDDPAWVLACLHEYTEVTDVDPMDDQPIPDLRVVRTRRPAAAPVY